MLFWCCIWAHIDHKLGTFYYLHQHSQKLHSKIHLDTLLFLWKYYWFRLSKAYFCWLAPSKCLLLAYYIPYSPRIGTYGANWLGKSLFWGLWESVWVNLGKRAPLLLWQSIFKANFSYSLRFFTQNTSKDPKMMIYPVNGPHRYL